MQPSHRWFTALSQSQTKPHGGSSLTPPVTPKPLLEPVCWYSADLGFDPAMVCILLEHGANPKLHEQSDFESVQDERAGGGVMYG
jgi:hypothetical protein